MAYRYIISDSRDTPLARAVLENAPDAKVWLVRILDEGVEAVLEHEVFKLIGLDEGAPDIAGKILRRRGDIVTLEPIQSLGEEIRNNLRVSIRFQSFIYSLSDRWEGRREITGHDLSCGGIAFFCQEELVPGEDFEVVLPITEPPLLLQARIIRLRPSNGQVQLYAAKYIDLLPEQEALVREAVFGLQIQHRDDRRSN